MANENIELFKFFKRYKWTEDDFTDWQTGMVDHSRGMFEGLLGGAVLDGHSAAVSGAGLALTVEPGICSGPSGYLLIENDQTIVILDDADATNPRRDLIVARPVLTDDTPIQRPTAPFDTVYLKELQNTEIIKISGTPAAEPEYPAKETNDVILMGVRVAANATSLVASDIDLTVREIPGKNSEFQQNFGIYDDRLRPYRASSTTIGIMPSQLNHPRPKAFSYVNKTTPSIFPKSAGGLYNGSAGAAIVNMETGTITGADEASLDFTPTIPSAGNAIVACLSLKTDDTLAVAYGTEGTRAQCLAGIESQVSVGAGSVSITTNTKPIAFVVVQSGDGVNVTELDFFDCRGIAAIGASAAGLAGEGITTPAGGEYPLTLTEADNGRVINVDTSAARTINLPSGITSGFKFTIKDYVGLAGTNAITIARAGSEEIEGLGANYLCEADFGAWNFIFDGTDWFIF